MTVRSDRPVLRTAAPFFMAEQFTVHEVLLIGYRSPNRARPRYVGIVPGWGHISGF